MAAIGDAGYTPGLEGVAIAIDPASSEFRQADGRYLVNGRSFTSAQMIERYQAIVHGYPVWLLEDGLAEDDWDGWQQLTRELGSRVELVGDDIFCTNPEPHPQGHRASCGQCVADQAEPDRHGHRDPRRHEHLRRCRLSAVHVAPLGETPDAFIADLAVATGCGHIKSGAPARGERVAKYNRLLEIAADHPELAYGLG